MRKSFFKKGKMRSRSNQSIRKINSAVIFISCETNEITLFNQHWVNKRENQTFVM